MSGLYRSPADYSPAVLEAATKGAERIGIAAQRVRDTLKNPPNTDEATTGRLIDIVDQHRMRFTSAMNDDFNAPLALSALFDMSKDINSAISDGTASKAVLEHAHSAYRELASDVLGVLRAESTAASAGSAEREARLIEMLIDLRLEARKAKDYSRADAIRNRLAQAGIILEDGPAGTAYRISD